MAMRNKNTFLHRLFKVKKRTAIGRSVRSRPKNKHKRRSWKKYRGQGKYSCQINGLAGGRGRRKSLKLKTLSDMTYLSQF